MTLTFLDIYNECAGQPWSMFDADAESVDDLETALKISINKAISYLWNYKQWSFRLQKLKLRTRTGRAEYSLPDGEIVEKIIDGSQKFGIIYDGKYLNYLDEYDTLEDREGEPESFYIEGESLYIYPTPDDVYTINLTYFLAPFGLNSNYEEIYELKEEDDYINVPEKYEVYFKNCLISLAMMYAIADENDENYSGYKKQYDDSLMTLLKYCKDNIKNRNVVW